MKLLQYRVMKRVYNVCSFYGSIEKDSIVV